MSVLKPCRRSLSRCWLMLAALVVMPVSLLAQSISGTVFNESDWLNDETLVPPQWHVDAAGGNVTVGSGRAWVSLFFSSDTDFADPLDQQLLEPLAPLNTISTNSWPYSLGSVLSDGAYTVVAWIDGNNNGQYDIGEPHGQTRAWISGASSAGGIEVRILEDYDTDGMEDWWEVHWFDTLSQRATMDFDNEGLTNIDEYNLIYSQHPDYLGIPIYVAPNSWDTDADGMDDAWELFYFATLQPTVVDDEDDPDNDRIINGDEYRGPDGVGRREDKNGDGIAEFTQSVDAMHPFDADSDHDGVNDDIEYLQDLTHPVHSMHSTNWIPRSLRMGVNTNGMVITDPKGGASFALGTGGGTVEFWVYPESDGDGTFYSFPGAGVGQAHYRLSLEDYRPKLELLNGTNIMATVGGVGNAGSVQQLQTNQWNHLAFVIAPANKTLSIHLDGVLLIAQKVLITPNFKPSIGAPAICTDFASGYLDELRVWNYPRPLADIDYWANRYYPAPGYVQMTATRLGGSQADMYAYNDPFPLMLYLRFDDGGDAVENYAFINHGLFPNPGVYRISGPITGAVTTAQAVPMFGSDDADGDELPEWWVDLYNMEKYAGYYPSAYGPIPLFCPDNPAYLLGFKYYRSFVGYASVGNQTGWKEEGSTVFYMPKTAPDFFEGDNSSYTKHVYLFSQPRSCPLNVYTPGMTSTVVYVNGTRVTTSGVEGDQTQQYDVAQYMKIGRNTVHVECQSTVMLTTSLSGYPYSINDYQGYSSLVPDAPLGCDEKPFWFHVAQGKFDAELSCNGKPVIVRGDKTRADARAVWHIQVWSSLFEESNQVPFPDIEYRDPRSNSDYGVPLNAERDNNPLDPDSADDGLDAVYEYIGLTNPRERDSNNNGVTDGDEDYDSDGLINREEQRFGSSVWLPDSDDDGIPDGVDVGSGHPAQSLSPQRNQSLRFGGGAGDYISMPLQQRFALEKWSIEAWIQPDNDESDGGILAQRDVGGGAVNYEVGLNASNQPYVRYVSVAGVEVVATAADAVVADGSTWTHVVATYYDRKLNLYIGGTNVATQVGGSFPALYAGGPIQQRIGSGFKGCIDEWRLWNTELSAERIAANIDEVLTGLEDDLVAYYRFDDGTSFDTGLPLVGTSANNGTNGVLPQVAWEWGQVEDNVLRYGSDWWLQWKHAASFSGSVVFSTNHIMQGPPRLQVFIENSDARDAGALWSYNGGASWNESGFVETYLGAGEYDISFNSIDGWFSPSRLPLTLVRGQSTTVTGTYVQTASLTVIIDNSVDIKEVATWSLDGGGTRRGSGTQVINLTPGSPGYDILFSDISADVPGWDRPATFNVQLLPGENRTVSASYTPVKGSLQVSFTPDTAPSAARWRVSGNTNWWASGQTVTNLSYGEHDLEYNEVDWWKSPTNETFIIAGSYLHAISRNWEKLPEPSTITVTIEPAAAISKGAQWSVNGAWYDSGQSVVVDAGSHVVTYRSLTGWLHPADVTLSAVNAAAAATGTYYRVDVAGSSDIGGFTSPWGLAASSRYIYVSDSGSSRIQMLDRVTGNWLMIASSGTAAGQFKQPLGVALAPNGDLWVADTGNHRIQRLDKNTGVWSAFGSYGSQTGQFNAPYDLDVDSAGNVYVADYHNSRVQKRQPNGVWSVIVRAGTQDGRVRYPSGVAMSADDSKFYISDYDPTGEGFIGRVQIFNTGGGFLERAGTSEDGNGGLNQNTGLGLMPDGSLLVANTRDNEVLRRDGVGNWDGIIVDGVVQSPRDIDADSWGNLIITDSGNSRVLILPADDADLDLLPDAQETTYGTLVNTADSDSDGFEDGAEVLMGTDPLAVLDYPVADNDFDGDGMSDVAVYHPTGGMWYIIRSLLGGKLQSWGWSSTIPVPGDYDGDGKTDVAVYHPAGGMWYIIRSSTGAAYSQSWGWSSTIPVPGDYDGDGKTDVAVYHPAGGMWYIIRSSTGAAYSQSWGWSSTIPVPGDYDGDGKTDVAVYHPAGGTWYIIRSSSNSAYAQSWGWSVTPPVPGDYDGDGKTDIAVYHPANGMWYIIQSSTGSSRQQGWGWSSARPVPGDYDGDGKTDIAVYHSASGNWYIYHSASGIPCQQNWGWSDALPITPQYQINRLMGY